LVLTITEIIIVPQEKDALIVIVLVLGVIIVVIIINVLNVL